MFNGGSSCASTIHLIDTKIGMVYLCVKGPLLACMNHINHEMYMHPCFLAPQVYLCSTSLRMLLTISLQHVYFLILVCYNEKFIMNMLIEQP